MVSAVAFDGVEDSLRTVWQAGSGHMTGPMKSVAEGRLCTVVGHS